MSTPDRIEEISAFIHQAFPEADLKIVELNEEKTVVHFPVGQRHWRPGGSVSGPTLFSAADATLYIAIMGRLGAVSEAVTTALNINFLSKAVGETVIVAECRLLKVGASLVVGDIWLFDQMTDKLVAQATGTYALPRATTPCDSRS